MTSRWDNPTGGFGYHLRAFARRDRTWAPFVRALARWLRTWQPPESRLVLVGPSGGHCLDLGHLARFAHLTAVDIDPFAPTVFRWRARALLRGGVTLAWDARDHLSPGPEGFDPAGLRGLVAAHPDSAFLFCNVLGQLPLLGDDRAPATADGGSPPGSFERWLEALPETLAGRSWASFHDRLSGPVEPAGVGTAEAVPWSSAEDLVARHYPLTDDPSLALLDHRTSGLCPEAPRWQMVWELVPGLFHLVEALAFTADRPASAAPAGASKPA